jgi:hypothetical protein
MGGESLKPVAFSTIKSKKKKISESNDCKEVEKSDGMYLKCIKVITFDDGTG